MHAMPLLAATALAAALTTAPSLADPPPVFSRAGFDADRAAAIGQDRLHLVYATAVWCPPCQQMKKTTWVDASVVSWIGEHAIATSLDVDEFRDKAGELGVRAMPTMILFEGNEELGRATGYRSAGDLVTWMEAGRTGEPMPEPARMSFDDGGGEDTVRPKLDAAQEMFAAGDYDRATEAYLDLWETMLDEQESYYGVRLSFMAGEMQQLAAAHEPARDAFRAVRDREATRLKAGDVEWDTLTDWVHLNNIIGDQQSTMAWVERIAERPESVGTLARYARDITEQAMTAGRWDVVALAIPDPVVQARDGMQFIRMMQRFAPDEENPADDPSSLVWHLRPPVIAALHANDGGEREAELVAYFDEAFGDSDAWRMAFIRIADECGKLRDDHTGWIEAFDLNTRYPGGVDVFEPEF